MISLLFRPLVTEKMTKLGQKGQYAFEVDLSSNKIDIFRAVEKKFNVQVESVRTMQVKGKSKTQLTKRGRFEGKTRHWKKAIVTLRKGDKIEFFENI
ncbi:MAG: 50S ribosomal protein L23 [Ignavibacteriales bacterium]|nr:50S ribosomal protein L23 [Ignavibacteriales bacterium]